ncbi:hypothetical protein BpHYR1_008364 [Brachionus plicatilis]|uniref:Uncharacterized protein n=1 Tax=Brachionus plicatilis TaxID=10195 RepID=A0A3M7PWK7_BRAPC|nr:hypothetical protein BpHYR1_008364 [Brachionus plicatilis]
MKLGIKYSRHDFLQINRILLLLFISLNALKAIDYEDGFCEVRYKEQSKFNINSMNLFYFFHFALFFCNELVEAKTIFLLENDSRQLDLERILKFNIGIKLLKIIITTAGDLWSETRCSLLFHALLTAISDSLIYIIYITAWHLGLIYDLVFKGDFRALKVSLEETLDFPRNFSIMSTIS